MADEGAGGSLGSGGGNPAGAAGKGTGGSQVAGSGGFIGVGGTIIGSGGFAGTGIGGSGFGGMIGTGGSIQCGKGFSYCGGLCINLATDPANCGACGRFCEVGQYCSNGVCNTLCSPGQVLCGNRCVDPASDPSHCGGCFAICPAGTTCAGGMCAPFCGDGEDFCNGRCVRILSDPNNCGGCGKLCGPDQVCDQAQCRGQGGLYTFTGVRQNVAIASLTGWAQCHVDAYGAFGTRLQGLLQRCNGAKLLLGCRQTGSNVLLLAAHANRADVLYDTGQSNTPHVANGVGWYFNGGWSWGFAPAGAGIQRNSCDVMGSSLGSGANGHLRLCWHTSGEQLAGGWRCGTATELNSAVNFERLIFHAP